MRPIPLIRAAVPRAVAALLADAGASAGRLWSRCALPGAADGDAERLLAFELVLRFIEECAHDQDAPDLGLHLAERRGLGATGRFGREMLRGTSLNGLIGILCETVAGHNSGARYWLVPDGDDVRLCRRFRCSGSDFRQTDLFTVALMTSVVRMVAGPTWRPSRIEMQSTDPRRVCSPTLLASLGDGPVETDRLTTSITFPRNLLARALPDAATRATERDAGWRDGPPIGFVDSLERVVESILETEHGDLAIAARAAGLSVRSFQRRLAEAGVTYSEVVDRVRFRKASEWLLDARVKIIDVSHALGYSDPAHFTRAFRRWTSVSPLQYRALHQAGVRRLA